MERAAFELKARAPGALSTQDTLLGQFLKPVAIPQQ